MIPDLVNVLYPEGNAYIWLRMEREIDDLDHLEAAEEKTVGEMNPVIQDEIDMNGLDMIFDSLSYMTEMRYATWAMMHGVAPGQPFLMRIGEPRVYSCGGYPDPEEFDVEHDIEFIRAVSWPIDRVTEAWREFWVGNRRDVAAENRRKRRLNTIKLRSVSKMRFDIDVYPGNNAGHGVGSYDYPPAGLIYSIMVNPFNTPFGCVQGIVAQVRDPDGDREKLKEALWEEVQKQGVPMDRWQFDALLKKRYA